MEAKVLKNMQEIKSVLEEDYRKHFVPKKEIEDITESIREIKDAARHSNRINGGNGNEKIMKGGKLLSRANLTTCFYIFVSVIAAYYSETIFYSTAEFLIAITKITPLILNTYIKFVIAANIGLSLLIAQDIYVCFVQCCRCQKSILDVIIRYTYGAHRIFRFNIDSIKFQGKIIIISSKAGFMVSKYIFNRFINIFASSIIAYEKLKPEMEIIIPDNLPDAPKITPIDNIEDLPGSSKSHTTKSKCNKTKSKCSTTKSKCNATKSNKK